MRLSLVILTAALGFSGAVYAQRFVPETHVKRGTRPRPAPRPQHTSQTNSWDKVEAWSFQFGTHTEFYNHVQTDGSGSMRQFAFSPTIGGGMRFSLGPGWKFLPELNWVLPFMNDSDSNMYKNLFMIRGDIGYDLLDWLRVRVGTSLMWLNIHGKGGKTTINNGAGQSTFYNPDENRSALNNTFDLGLEGLLSDDWSARLQTYTYSLFQEERRQLSYSLFLTHYWE